MSFFSSPASVPAKPEPAPDPNIVAQRQAIAADAAAQADNTAKKAQADFQARTMGTQGANALFTSGAAGYPRTMGAANI